ncbi:MAG: putative zinc-binding metallopeptidase [Gordonia sp. (in: high G+C Gram-positive bacteria)]
MRAFACPVCSQFLEFEWIACRDCSTRVGLHPPSQTIVPLSSYDDVPASKLRHDWKWRSLFFNRINAAMGKAPLYPFELPAPVVEKLACVHRVVRDAASASR